MFRLGLCQLSVEISKEDNIQKAEKLIKEAAKKGAQIISLPEMWNCPYSNKFFPKYAEVQGGQTFQFMAELAKELGVYIIGGSIPEKEIGEIGERAETVETAETAEKIYNTAYTFDPSGALIGKHRKAHLFDINITGGISFQESETLSPGNSIDVIDTEFGKIGVAICFDVRFPDVFMKMAKEGAKLVVLPGAFNMTTGPAHWELTMRARALDNQMYFAAVSPAREDTGHYVAYGHSCVVNPWGEVVIGGGTKECVIVAEIDFEYVDSIREQLPLLKSRREQLY